MKPIYHHYSEWEDWKNGMYSSSKQNWQDKISSSIEILTSENLYEKMKFTCQSWTNSAEENLSDETINARPWLGRAVCCFYCKATEDMVREAWFKLTADQMNNANIIADRVISEWRNDHAEFIQTELMFYA